MGLIISNCFAYFLLYAYCVIFHSARLNVCQKSLQIPIGAIRIRILKKNRQHNGQKEKVQKGKHDPQNIHIKLLWIA